MYLSEVIGTVVSTQKDATLVGNKLLLTRRIDEAGAKSGLPEVAIDTVGAGVGETVIITRGSSARYAFGKRETVVDATIVGIVDTVEISGAYMPAVYTRTGDKGTTGLFGGSRVSKDDARVEAYGTLDEANAAIGVAKAHLPAGEWKDALHAIQHRIFVVCAELASDDKGREILAGKVGEKDITDLEHLIDKCLEFTGPQRFFVVPGRDPASAHLHLARTVVRRAERRIITGAAARPELIKYVNRLSDTVYALARVAETMHTQSRIAEIVRRVVTEAVRGAKGPTRMDAFDLTVAQAMAAAAEEKANQLGVPIVFAAVDAGGNTILLHRQPDSLLVSLDLAVGKAFTAAALKQPTAGLKPLAIEDGPLFGIEASNQGRIVLFGGGEPVFVDGRIAGGIGISGGTVEEDIEIVKHALEIANGVNR